MRIVCLTKGDGTFDITSDGDGISAGNWLQADGGVYTVKAGGGRRIDSERGKYSLDSADDTIHSNANITISDGEFTLASGDDGIHADSATTISGGTIDITESYEGIEGLSIDITGGDTTVTASDDGLNATGGNDSSGFSGSRKCGFSF